MRFKIEILEVSQSFLPQIN